MFAVVASFIAGEIIDALAIIFIVLMAMMIFKQDFDASDVGKIYIVVIR